MNINKFAEEVHQNAVEHGWYDEKVEFTTIVSLIHSEVSEAFSEYRNGNPNLYYEGESPEGVAVELADDILRILDYCAYVEIDIESILKLKHEYNKTRPYRHDNKKC